jgi:hypothetical protein
MTTTRWVNTATAAFEDALAELIGEQRPLTDPAEAGRRAALDAVAGSMWAENVGPFYDTESVMMLLGNVTKQAIHDRVRRHRLLALRTASGRLVYPAAQFQRRQVVAGLGDVLDVLLPDDTEAWVVAAWLTSPDPDLDGETPVAALKAGRIAEVVQAARDVATIMRG